MLHVDFSPIVAKCHTEKVTLSCDNGVVQVTYDTHVMCYKQEIEICGESTAYDVTVVRLNGHQVSSCPSEILLSDMSVDEIRHLRGMIGLHVCDE